MCSALPACPWVKTGSCSSTHSSSGVSDCRSSVNCCIACQIGIYGWRPSCRMIILEDITNFLDIGKRTIEVLNMSLTGHLRSEEHTSELQSRENLVCRLLLEKKKIK